MIYELKYEARAVKQIKKLDPATRKLIKSWIEKNLLNTDNPRAWQRPDSQLKSILEV